MKRFLSIALALVMGLVLAAPAAAAKSPPDYAPFFDFIGGDEIPVPLKEEFDGQLIEAAIENPRQYAPSVSFSIRSASWLPG